MAGPRLASDAAGMPGMPGAAQALRRPTGPGRLGLVVSGGPWDPADPWYCEGHYQCFSFFGELYCFWVCEMY